MFWQELKTKTYTPPPPENEDKPKTGLDFGTGNPSSYF